MLESVVTAYPNLFISLNHPLSLSFFLWWLPLWLFQWFCSKRIPSRHISLGLCHSFRWSFFEFESFPDEPTLQITAKQVGMERITSPRLPSPSILKVKGLIASIFQLRIICMATDHIVSLFLLCSLLSPSFSPSRCRLCCQLCTQTHRHRSTWIPALFVHPSSCWESNWMKRLRNSKLLFWWFQPQQLIAVTPQALSGICYSMQSWVSAATDLLARPTLSLFHTKPITHIVCSSMTATRSDEDEVRSKIVFSLCLQKTIGIACLASWLFFNKNVFWNKISTCPFAGEMWWRGE